MKKLNIFAPFIFIIIFWFGFSYPFFLQGKVPFSSTYQMNFFPPWSTYQELAGPVKNNAQPDIITQIYPWRFFAVNEYKNGRIPLWNPYSFAGTPHLANYQSGALFPLNIVFFIGLEFVDGWSVLVLLQPLLAGIFAYIFARTIEITRKGSLIAAISFMFCGFITTWMGYATLGYAILFLPLSLFSIEKYFSTKEKKYGCILSFSIMCSLFAGHFQASLYFLIVTFLYLIFKIFSSAKKEKLIFGYFTFGLLLAMPQILPSIEFYTNSVRSQLFQAFEVVPWRYLPTVISPDFYGNPVTRNDWFGHYAEWASFAGAVSMSLALYNLFSKKNKVIIFFLVLSIVTFLLAYNTPLISLLVYLKIPVLSTSSVSRILVIFSFSLAILAGFGFDSLLNNIKKSGKSIYYWAFLLVLILVGVFIFGFFGLPVDKRSIAIKNSLIPAVLILFLLVGVFVIKFSKSKFISAYFPLILISLAGFEMLRFASKWQSFDDKQLVFKSVPTTERYLKGFSVDRVFGDFTAENSVYYGIQALGGYDPLYPSRYGKFVQYIKNGLLSEGERSVVNFPKKGEYVGQALDFLGVKYISHKVSDGNFPWAFPFSDYEIEKFTPIYDDSHYRIFNNNTSFNRFFMVFNTINAKSEREILDKMFSVDLSKVAIVESASKLRATSTGKVELINYDPTHIKLRVDSSDKGLLVTTDNYYPGWIAKVNGATTPIERVDFTFRGVMVPKGKSIVEMYYIPKSFTFGVYLFLLGVMGIILIPVYNKISKQK